MGEYIMMLIGAGVMSAMSEIISPERWNKYIKIFTGVLIAILIISPMKKFDMNVLDDISYTAESPDESTLKKEIQHSLESRINDDITLRIKDSFGYDSVVVTDVLSDKDGNILGISNIKIKTSANKGSIKKMICEIYGVDEKQVHVDD